jgi:hypothetical protein
VPKKCSRSAAAIIKAISPIQLTITAFKLAFKASVRVYQKPISKYENIPTPSQPRNTKARLFAVTRITMANVEPDKYFINVNNQGSPAI